VSLLVSVRRDARLEVWAARRRTALLERLLGLRVRVATARAEDRAREPARAVRAGGRRAVGSGRRGLVIPLRRGKGAAS
jgi:hypothetical protein